MESDSHYIEKSLLEDTRNQQSAFNPVTEVIDAEPISLEQAGSNKDKKRVRKYNVRIAYD